MNQIVIENEAEALALLDEAMSDIEGLKDKSISIDPSVLSYCIEIKGPKYDGTITPAVMRSILALQDAVYTLYQEERYGGRKRLTAEEKARLDVIVKVDHGSSIINIDWAEVVKVFANMDGTQVLIGLGMLLATLLGKQVLSGRSEERKKKIEAQMAAAATEERKETLVLAQHMIETVEDAGIRMVRALSSGSFDTLKLEGVTYTPDELKALAPITRKREEPVQKVIDAAFMVTDIHFEDDETYIDAKDVSNGRYIRGINLQAGSLAEGDFAIIKNAENRETLPLRLIVEYKKDDIVSARLDSIRKS